MGWWDSSSAPTLVFWVRFPSGGSRAKRAWAPRHQPRPGWAPDPLMGWWDSSSAPTLAFWVRFPTGGPRGAKTHLGSKVFLHANHGEARSADGSSWRGSEGGRRRRRGGRGWRRASDPFSTHTTSHAHTARSRARPLVFVTAVSHMRAGPMVSATSWSCKLSTPHSHRHQFCIATARFSMQALRSLDHRNPTSAQRASPARSVSPLVCGSACLPASPPYACSSPSHANRSTGQRITTQSSTVLARREELAHRGEFFFLFFFDTTRKLSEPSGTRCGRESITCTRHDSLCDASRPFVKLSLPAHRYPSLHARMSLPHACPPGAPPTMLALLSLQLPRSLRFHA